MFVLQIRHNFFVVLYIFNVYAFAATAGNICRHQSLDQSVIQGTIQKFWDFWDFTNHRLKVIPDLVGKRGHLDQQNGFIVHTRIMMSS